MTTSTPNFRELCAELLDVCDNPSPPQYKADVLNRARAALATPPGPPKNCWLDDEPDLCPRPCVFDDPSEVISNCTYAQTVKCKTDCQYYRAATPPPEPPNWSAMPEIKRYKLDAAFVALEEFDSFSKPEEFLEVSLWHNGEGFDAHISSQGDQLISLSWGQFKALKKLVKELDQ